MNVKGKPRGLSENNLINNSYLDNRIGFWGTVKDVHPETNRVDVLMDIGILLPGIPVGMNEFVKENNIGGNTFYSGKINLPARESYVFCLMPNHTVTSAFVLCSGIPYGNDYKKKFFAETEKEKNDFPEIEKFTDQEGWTITKKRDTGNLFIQNVDGSIQFELCRENDKQDSSKKKGVKAVCHGTTITIDGTGKVNCEVQGDLSLKSSSNITIEGATGKFKVN